ncbi:MAG: adenylosuccinate synthase [Planctomycetota bacterium]
MPTATPAANPNSDHAAEAAERLLSPGHAAIVGLQWGDEGKGQTVDLLTPHFNAIARFNGGNNAGHSVHVGNEKFALHLLPSGITHPGVLCVIGNGVVVDPSPETGLLKEIKALADRGITVDANKLRISNRAHVVMPYHRVEDGLYEALAKAGKSEITAGAIGTTGRGIGRAYADKAHRSTAIRMGDLLVPNRLHDQLRPILQIKNALLQALADLAGVEYTPFELDTLLQQAADWAEALRPMIGDTTAALTDIELNKGRVLFEGANAALLDVDHGTYPYVTSSTTSALGAATGTGLAPRHLHNVLGVAKAYTSRVGGGPHPTELLDDTGEHIRTTGNEFGTTTGRPRRVGWLDLTAVKYSAQLNGCTALVLTGLSVLAGLPELKLAVAYEHDGQRLDTFPADAFVLEQATPIYQTLPCFPTGTGDATAFADLPDAAKAYVQAVEDFVGIPIKLVCVGPKRSQALPR